MENESRESRRPPRAGRAARRLSAVRELLAFLWRERLWWMLPIVVALVLLAALVMLGSSPAVAPFIYVLF